MKILILLNLLSFFFIPLAQAEIYILVDKNKEVRSVSPENDGQLEKDWTKHIIKSDFKELELQYQPTDYKFKNGKFVANIKKMSDRELNNEKYAKKAKKDKLIMERMKKIAKQQLIEEGIIDE